VSSLVGELIDTGLLRELGQGTSAGGKPPTLLALNERGREIVALDLGRRPFRGALIDLSGRIHERVEADPEPVAPTGEQAHHMVTKLIESLIARASAPILGIGVGTPGVVDADGTVLEAANLDWHGLELGAVLRRRFNVPVSIANDAAMAALVEYRRRPADRNLVLVKLGRGIGAGVVINGALHRGEHSAAGEIGHVRALDHGERCRCGNTGCLETVASVPAILRRAGADPDRHPWDALALAGLVGEDPVRRALTEAGRHLASALANVVALLDIGHVVLAPDLLNAGDILIDEIRTELAARILPTTADFLEIEATQLGGDLVLAGAASGVVVDHLGVTLR
jgi:predicted NBD/HSP70 family sugar kinase